MSIQRRRPRERLRELLASAGTAYERMLAVLAQLLGNLEAVMDARPLLEDMATAYKGGDHQTVAKIATELSGMGKHIDMVKKLGDTMTPIYGGGAVQIIETERKVLKLDAEQDKARADDFAKALTTRRRFYNALKADDPRRLAISREHPEVIDVTPTKVEDDPKVD